IPCVARTARDASGESIMRLWPPFRDRSVEDFADAIRPELKELETPKARPELFERIAASRNAGARVILPHEASPHRTSLVGYAGAVAAVLVAGVLGSMLLSRGTGGDEPFSAPTWFVGAAFAQTPADVVPPIRASAIDRLHPFTVNYEQG